MNPTQSTVLLVEDYDDTREFMRMLLEMKGFRVFEAVNGKEAVALAPQIKPDLILMDLEMPVLNGYEATRQIRAIPAMRDVPVIAVSAHCSGELQNEALAAGCAECICKPVDISLVDGVIERYFRH
ncbi:MAG: response regulator [Pyrinomonadaceae bacterium]